MPYWIHDTLLATPALLLMFIGVGLPFALLATPRSLGRQPMAIAVLSFAFGSALITFWLFILGTLGATTQTATLHPDTALAGTVGLATLAWAIFLSKNRQILFSWRSWRLGGITLEWDAALIAVLIVIALIVRWLGVAYWPSTAYDARWVFAYEGELYALKGFIPNSIGYYPQLLPLSHTYIHLLIGAVNDHAARAILPCFQLASILAAYLLGEKLSGRRTGLFLAAIWAFYPHMGEWSRYGDLEVPLTFFFTSAAAFALPIYKHSLVAIADTASAPILPLRLERGTAGEVLGRLSAFRNEILAGLLLGIGLWTKPTMGAWVWGLVLITALPLLRRDVAAFRAALRSSFIILLCAAPLGGVWYIRNLLLGHAAVDFPPAYWLTIAARSGVEFGWPLLALSTYAVWSWQRTRTVNRRLWLGVALIWGATLPSILNSGRIGIVENRMGVLAWLLLAAGVALFAWGASWRPRHLGSLSLTYLFALPYFVTWFYSYSYSFRLSFAIVPLLILPTAHLLADWLPTPPKSSLRRLGYAVILVALAIPAIINPLYDINAGWDWLWTDKLPDDHARHVSGNTALMAVVDGLQIYKDTHSEPMRVSAPGVKQLPFFFPLDDIQIDRLPTHLSELDGFTYFIYATPETGDDFAYFQPGHNQVLDALARATDGRTETATIMRRAWWQDDGIFKYTVFELSLAQRFQKPQPYPADGDVQFGGFVRFIGHNLSTIEWYRDRTIFLSMFWQVLAPPPGNYFIYVHLRDAEGNLQANWDGPISWSHDGNYYSSLLWETGEYISDLRILKLEKPIPIGTGYHLYVGLYDPVTNERVPLTVNGLTVDGGYRLFGEQYVIEPPS